VAASTVDAVRQVDAPAVIVITRSGFSARLVSSYRPPVPVFAVTTDPLTYRQLAAVWGVRPVMGGSPEQATYQRLLGIGREAVVESGLGEPGALVVATSGYPFHEPGTTNTMRLERL
jgi:pyruvate kinase